MSIIAESCPTCGETFYPQHPGTGERCRTCQYREHSVRITLDSGGGYRIRCSCGQYTGTAPTLAAAERAGGQHVEDTRGGAR